MIEIRELRQGDSEHVLKLDQRIRGEDRSVTWDRYVERLLSVVALDSLEYVPWGCFVATDSDSDGRIVGFLMSERQSATYGLPPGVRIVAMAVDPEHRRQHIGTRLLETLGEKAKSEGVSSIFSVLLNEDERDAAFLGRCGFESGSFKVFSKEL